MKEPKSRGLEFETSNKCQRKTKFADLKYFPRPVRKPYLIVRLYAPPPQKIKTLHQS